MRSVTDMRSENPIIEQDHEIDAASSTARGLILDGVAGIFGNAARALFGRAA